MTDIADRAMLFFDACETGKGWTACAPYCLQHGAFASQAEPLNGITTLEAYTGWMQGVAGAIPDGRYDIHALATDPARNSVCIFATFHGTHTAPGGPVPPTGRTVATDYVYVMRFEGDRIAHMTKVWNAGWALREIGWA